MMLALVLLLVVALLFTASRMVMWMRIAKEAGELLSLARGKTEENRKRRELDPFESFHSLRRSVARARENGLARSELRHVAAALVAYGTVLGAEEDGAS